MGAKKLSNEEQIIEIANLAIYQHWVKTSDVSKATQAAQKVCNEWQNYLHHIHDQNIKTEVKVSKFLNERIDVIDYSEGVAYELKVSPNNTHFEFYKDVFKIIAYNQSNPDRMISRLIFMTPGKGGPSIKEGLGLTAIEVARAQGIHVDIVQLKTFK